MSRTACVWIPQFELRERLRALEAEAEVVAIRGEGHGIILADIGAPAPRVVDASAEARAFGVRPRMPMVRARALCPEALLIPPDAESFHGERERVLRGLYQFGPQIGVDECEAFFLSLAGLARLHPDEQALARTLRDEVERLGYPAAVAIADSPVSAWIVARAASFALATTAAAGPAPAAATNKAGRAAIDDEADERCRVVAPGADREVLAALPLGALPMSEQVIRLCRVLGLDRVGELARLPVGALTRRFGREGAVLEARSRARARDLFEVCVPEQVEQAELHLDQPTDDLEVLLFLHKNVLDRLLAQVRATRRYVAALEVSLLLADSERTRLVHLVRPARPTLDGRLLLDLLLLWLQSGPASDVVDSIVMRAVEVGEAPRRQLRLFEKHEDLAADAFALATSRLTAAFGRDAVVQPELTDSHRPEARVAWRCPLPVEGAKPKGAQKREKREKKKVRGWVARGLGRAGAQPADDLFALLEGQGEGQGPSMLDVAAVSLPPALELLDAPRPIALRGSWLRLPEDDDGGRAGTAPEVVEVGAGPVVVVEEVRGKVVPLHGTGGGCRPRRSVGPANQRRAPGWRRIVERLGPYSLEGEWWEREGFSRRYELLTLDDGSQLWIFHDGRGAHLQAYLD